MGRKSQGKCTEAHKAANRRWYARNRVAVIARELARQRRKAAERAAEKAAHVTEKATAVRAQYPARRRALVSTMGDATE